MPRITKKGARNVTRTMERLADLMEKDFGVLGIPQHIAADASRRLDLLSDAIERHAGINPQDTRTKQALDGFNAEMIGQEKSGPLEMETDEPFMKGEFSAQENRELREKQEAGDLPDGSPEPRPPKAGVQAAFKGLVGSLKGTKMTDKQAAAVERALRLATSVVLASKKAEEDEEEVMVEEAEKESGKKGEDEKEEPKESAKKASHGFNLYE